MNAAEFDDHLFSYLSNSIATNIPFFGTIALGLIYKAKIGDLHEGMKFLGFEDSLGKVDLAKLRENLDGGLLFLRQPFHDMCKPFFENAKMFLMELEKKAQ